MNTHPGASSYLLGFGIKPSVQRIAIVDFLMEYRIHPTADEIYNALYEKVPTLSKTTIYNTLKLFADRGVVTLLMIDDKNVRFDIDTTFHAHFQCCSCNRVFDIPVEKPALLKIKEIKDFSITESHLYYKGYCKNCQGGVHPVEEREMNPLNNINQ